MDTLTSKTSQSLTINEWVEQNPQVTKEQLVEEIVLLRRKNEHLTRLFHNECTKHARTRSELQLYEVGQR